MAPMRRREVGRGIALSFTWLCRLWTWSSWWDSFQYILGSSSGKIHNMSDTPVCQRQPQQGMGRNRLASKADLAAAGNDTRRAIPFCVVYQTVHLAPMRSRVAFNIAPGSPIDLLYSASSVLLRRGSSHQVHPQQSERV